MVYSRSSRSIPPNQGPSLTSKVYSSTPGSIPLSPGLSPIFQVYPSSSRSIPHLPGLSHSQGLTLHFGTVPFFEVYSLTPRSIPRWRGPPHAGLRNRKQNCYKFMISAFFFFHPYNIKAAERNHTRKIMKNSIVFFDVPRRTSVYENEQALTTVEGYVFSS